MTRFGTSAQTVWREREKERDRGGKRTRGRYGKAKYERGRRRRRKEEFMHVETGSRDATLSLPQCYSLAIKHVCRMYNE